VLRCGYGDEICSLVGIAGMGDAKPGRIWALRAGAGLASLPFHGVVGGGGKCIDKNPVTG
jgi:hypothetical protein